MAERWLLMALLVVMSARIAKPQNTRAVGEAQAGIWVRENSPSKPKVITLELARVACYAYSPNYQLHHAFEDPAAPPGSPSDPKRVSYWGVVDYAVRIGATHVVLDENRIGQLVPGFVPDLLRADAAAAHPRLAIALRIKRSQRDEAPTLIVCQIVHAESD